MTQHRALLVGLAAVGLLAVACGDDASTSSDTSAVAPSSTAAPDATAPPTTSGTYPDPVIDPGDGGDYAPALDPADFVAAVDNPFLPLTPGNTWTYEEVDEEGVTELVEVEVLEETRDIAGISATVVRDTVSIDGVVQEDTYDWFAQDVDGNVWYLGEDVSNYDEQGNFTDNDGSFEHGVDGAFGGIAMPGDPQVGDAYRQEFHEGSAEDLGQILALDGTASVPFGEFDGLLVTRDWNPLDPEVIEEKYYAPGVGVILETHVRGGGGDVQLLDATLAG
jgi:hypothetical protein